MAEYWFDSYDGLRLYSRIYPAAADAPVLLCLHGLMRTGRDFIDLAEHLAPRYRVIVPDVRGRGLSARDAHYDNYQISVYLQDVLTLLAGLGAPRVSIVGTSMGGLMAMVLAVLQPGLVQRIVINDVGPEIDPVGLERLRGYVGRDVPVKNWAEAIVQLRDIYGVAWPDLSEERWERIARLSYRADADGVPRSDADPAIALPLRRASAVPDLWAFWKQLRRIPVLVIRGALSDVLTEGILARMQREKRDLEVLTVPNRGHPPLLDEPECVAAIDRFLSG